MNPWALLCGVLLLLLNMYIYASVHTMILHSNENPLMWNILHICLWAGIGFSFGCGFLGISGGCVGGIGVMIWLFISRWKNEYFESGWEKLDDFVNFRLK